MFSHTNKANLILIYSWVLQASILGEDGATTPSSRCPGSSQTPQTPAPPLPSSPASCGSATKAAKKRKSKKQEQSDNVELNIGEQLLAIAEERTRREKRREDWEMREAVDRDERERLRLAHERQDREERELRRGHRRFIGFFMDFLCTIGPEQADQFIWWVQQEMNRFSQPVQYTSL